MTKIDFEATFWFVRMPVLSIVNISHFINWWTSLIDQQGYSNPQHHRHKQMFTTCYFLKHVHPAVPHLRLREDVTNSKHDLGMELYTTSSKLTVTPPPSQQAPVSFGCIMTIIDFFNYIQISAWQLVFAMCSCNASCVGGNFSKSVLTLVKGKYLLYVGVCCCVRACTCVYARVFNSSQTDLKNRSWYRKTDNSLYLFTRWQTTGTVVGLQSQVNL